MPVRTDVDAAAGRERSAVQRIDLEAARVPQLPPSYQELEVRVAALNATAIFSATDARGRIVEVNDKFCEISGYSRDELLGRSHRILNSGAHTPEFFRAMYQTIAGGAVWRGELRNRARSGEFYWVDTTIIPRCDSAGRIAGYASVRIDITERKRAEQAVQTSEALFRTTLMALSEGVVVQDADGRIVSSNPAADRILGLRGDVASRGAVIDPRCQAIREDGRPFPDAEQPAMMALQTGEPQRRTVMGLRRDDGSLTWISINAEPIFAAGATRPTSVVTSLSDITLHKRAQDVLTEAVNASPDALVIYDEHDRLVTCNAAYREIYAESAAVIRPGVLFEDVLRYGLAQNQYPEAGDTAEQQQAWLVERMRLHHGASPDVVHQLAKGRWILLRERRTASGCTVGFRVDVTELKLKTAELRAVIENFPGGISFLDADYRIVACNDRFRDLFSLPPELFEDGQPTLEAVIRANAVRGEYGPGDPDEQVRARLQLLTSGKAIVSELIRPDGAVLEIRGNPVHGGGFVTTYMDVTERYATERRLSDSEQRARTQSDTLQLTLAHMSQGLSMFDADARLVVWNDRYIEMYELPVGLVRPGASFRTILEYGKQAGNIEADIDCFIATLQRDLLTHGKVTLTPRLRDGRLISVVHTAVRGGGWVATHEDVTEKQRAEFLLLEKADELARINMRFEAALANMSQGLCLFDADKKLVISNRRFREMYSFTEQQLTPGTTLRQMLKQQIANGQTSDQTLDQHETAIPTRANEMFRLADGRVFAIRRTPTPDGGWVATHEDVTERERADRQISHLAYHDALTGLANRAEFKARGEAGLTSAADRAGWISVLLVDLDRFKAVNDTFGHAAGDRLLQLVAERMCQHVPKGGLVARLGGDEFAILVDCESNQRDAALALAGRLIEALGQAYDLDGRQAVIGASIGVALEMKRGDTIEQLMHQADLALYRVKAAGRNGCRIYEDGLGSQADERRHLENDLRTAISAGGLELYYQPIVALADETVRVMEALVRWNHPTRGMLPPDQFITLAEETGMIIRLGEFVIRQACLDVLSWPEQVKVAINISPTHLKSGTLADTVVRALGAARVPAERLEIEVTETVLLQHDEVILAELHRLQDLGISVALDDFGTGYSSLSHLRMFTFDKIKIDRSFVAEMTERTDSAAIVCAVTGLARNLDILTTAEGIETEQQLEMVRAAGCVHGQGFLFGRPRPAVEAAALLSSGLPLRRSA